MKENESVVRSLGFLKLSDIGVHSIRKGVSMYLASLPGGPSPAALSLRGGWSMGQVRDIYFQHSQGGDEHAGCCASMLNMMSDSFACSPAFFTMEVGDADLEEAIRMTFPHHCNMPEMQRILERCLASILHHQPTMEEWNSNHLGLQMPIFCDKELLQSLVDVVDVHQAWDSDLVLTGIPPFIKQIQELHIIR